MHDREPARASSDEEPGVRVRSRKASQIRAGRRNDVLIGAFFVVLVAGPMLFSNRVFEVDMTNFMWMGSGMSHTLFHGLSPSFFINARFADPNNTYFNSNGIFNPVYAFYGGPLYAFFGILIRVLGGSATAALDVLVVFALSAAYGGSVWIARQCRLTGLLAHVPAIAVVTAPYYLSNLYGRSDFPEFIALSMIPLVAAGAVHLVRAPSWKPGPTAVFVVSVFFFTGSHNITLLWGSVIAATVLVVLAVVVRPHVPPVKRLAGVAGVIMLATLVNAWFLLPDIVYSGSTQAAEQAPKLIGALNFFDRFTLLFNPFRAVPKQSGSPAMYVQAPVWFIMWALGCGAWIWIGRPRTRALLRNVWTALAVILIALFVLRTNAALFRRLPATLKVIQFPLRLDGYILLLTAGVVLASGLAVQGATAGRARPLAASLLVASLVGVCAMSVGLAVWQEWVPRSCPPPNIYPQCVANRTAGKTPVHVLPTTWGAGNYYTDTSAAILPVAPGRSFDFSPDLVDAHGDNLTATVDPPAGIEPFVTNIMGGPGMVSIGGGIERLGRTDAGYAVVRRVQPGPGPIRVEIRTADSPAIRIGRALSVIGVIGVALLLWMVTRRDRQRRSV